MTTVLLTGFEPFDGARSNVSFDAVHAAADQWRGPAHLEIARLPVTFSGAFGTLMGEVTRLRPDVVIACGYAAGRRTVSAELVAVNWRAARIADNDGFQPRGEFIDAAGPAAYFSTLPVQQIADAATRHGVEGEVSLSAGGFVCNDVFYRLMASAEAQGLGQAGFIHIGQIDTGAAAAALAGAVRCCLER